MSTIDELVPLSETLNTESNDLNKTIAKVSDKLAALKLGIEVWFSTECRMQIVENRGPLLFP
jgi:hypothetical protein